MIAGSYTPLLLISTRHHMIGRFLAVAEWCAALFGACFAGTSPVFVVCYLLLVLNFCVCLFVCVVVVVSID